MQSKQGDSYTFDILSKPGMLSLPEKASDEVKDENNLFTPNLTKRKNAHSEQIAQPGQQLQERYNSALLVSVKLSINASAHAGSRRSPTVRLRTRSDPTHSRSSATSPSATPWMAFDSSHSVSHIWKAFEAYLNTELIAPIPARWADHHVNKATNTVSGCCSMHRPRDESSSFRANAEYVSNKMRSPVFLNKYSCISGKLVWNIWYCSICKVEHYTRCLVCKEANGTANCIVKIYPFISAYPYTYLEAAVVATAAVAGQTTTRITAEHIWGATIPIVAALRRQKRATRESRLVAEVATTLGTQAVSAHANSVALVAWERVHLRYSESWCSDWGLLLAVSRTGQQNDKKRCNK